MKCSYTYAVWPRVVLSHLAVALTAVGQEKCDSETIQLLESWLSSTDGFHTHNFAHVHIPSNPFMLFLSLTGFGVEEDRAIMLNCSAWSSRPLWCPSNTDNWMLVDALRRANKDETLIRKRQFQLINYFIRWIYPDTDELSKTRVLITGEVDVNSVFI
jgi:hypothetical protein